MAAEKHGRVSGYSESVRLSDAEELLAFQIKAVKLPEPQREFRFSQDRRWRFDFAWPAQKVACEVEGATWANGRHTRGSGFEKDCEKYNAATLNGWRVLRVPSNWVKDGRALVFIRAIFGEIGLDSPKA